MLSLEDKLRGAAVLELLVSIGPEYRLNLAEEDARGSYRIQVETRGLFSKKKTFGLFMKSSNKRRSPWAYSFHHNHQAEVLRLKQKYDQVFVLFLNGDDGVACLDYESLKEVLDENFEEQENVTISRKPRESYRVSGRDGKLDRPLARNSFPGVINEWLSSQL